MPTNVIGSFIIAIYILIPSSPSPYLHKEKGSLLRLVALSEKIDSPELSLLDDTISTKILWRQIGQLRNLIKAFMFEGKKGGKDQESIQSSTTPDLGYRMRK